MKVSRMNGPKWSRRQNGFTMLQVLITVAIIAIVTAFGYMGIVNARAMTRVQNSARMFAAYAEKARADSIRRHVAPGSESWIQSTSAGGNTFTVRMDFDGSGNVQTRTFTLEPGVTFGGASAKATFDWRGRINEALVFQIYNRSIDKSIPVDISGSGDITIDSQVWADELIPDVALTTVTGDIATPTPALYPTPTPTPTPNPDPNATATPTPTPTATPTPCANQGLNCRTPTPTPTPAGTPIPTPTPGTDPSPSPSPVLPQCAVAVNPTTLTLSQTISAQRTGIASLTLTGATGAHSISLAAAGGGTPLVLSVSPTSLTGDGTATITVTSKTGAGNRGTFTVKITTSPSCGATQDLSVTVKN
jgi:prepilin-type N-terminal cleavage/methylation domain-containing protein